MYEMSQTLKTELKDKVEKVLPRGWRYRLSVRDRSTLVMTIKEAPVNLLENFDKAAKIRGFAQVSKSDFSNSFEGDTLHVMKRVNDALNAGNHDPVPANDESKIGWYVNINIGRPDHPFIYKH